MTVLFVQYNKSHTRHTVMGQKSSRTHIFPCVFHIKPYFNFGQPNSATIGAETAYRSGAPVFCVMLKISLLVLVSFFCNFIVSFFNLRLSDYPFATLQLFLILLYNHRHVCHFASTFKFKS